METSREKLRRLANTLRRNQTPLSDFIPLLQTVADELDAYDSLLGEAASKVSLIGNGCEFDEDDTKAARELWGRCMVQLGHEKSFVDSILNKPGKVLEIK